MNPHQVHAMTGEILQAIILAGLLGWSLFFMLRRLAPNLVRTQQLRLAQALQNKGYVKIAKWLEPALVSAGGCGSGCSNCSSCGSNPNLGQAEQVQAVQWKTPSKGSGCH